MKFVPKSEQEVRNLLPDGVYNAECIEAEETQRKASGAPMFSVKLKVFDGDREVYVNDWLLTDVPSMAFKLRHFCYSANLDERYERGELEDWELVGTSLRVKIRTDSNQDFGPQNRVVDYVTTAEPKSKTPKPEKLSDTLPGTPRKVDSSEEIPF